MELPYLPYRIPSTEKRRLLDPHVVIIGAGASIASCQTDKNGKQVPALANIHKIIGLTDELNGYGFSEKEMENFELLFSNIVGVPKYSELQRDLENAVRNYFQSLEIPEGVTLYDCLILSLTEKDAIISFNWDPFLLQAYQRNIKVGNLPQLIFPHGNVGVGICLDCKIKGYSNFTCPRCLKSFGEMPLLFPIQKKNYHDNVIIKNEWRLARDYLSRAAGITIFGYSAPETDIEAYNILKESYKKSNIIRIAPFTIINLKSQEDIQREKWSEIFDEHMVVFLESLKESDLWISPRVSLEHLFDAILQQEPRAITKSYKDFKTLEELQNFVQTITEFDMAI